MLNTESADLLDIAVNYIKDNYIENRHHVVCALVANSHLYLASHLDSPGGLDVCAEPIALSNAIADGNDDFQTLVTVAWNGYKRTRPWVIMPCGNCRQILTEYAPDLHVMVDDDKTTVPLRDLLPYPYTKR